MGEGNLTPEFKKVLRGYQTDEVDEFITQISAAYEQLRRESFASKEETERQKKQLEYFHSLENSLNKALIAAQQKAEEIVNTAHDEVNRSLIESKARLENINNEINKLLADAAEKGHLIEEEAKRHSIEILDSVREKVRIETDKQTAITEKIENIRQEAIDALKKSLIELEGSTSTQKMLGGDRSGRIAEDQVAGDTAGQ